MLSAIRPSINAASRQSVFLAQRRTVISLAKTVVGWGCVLTYCAG
ncbi:hypothetical protein RSAG8_05658, partial [Rhizoctonia solani AG-8 WAC10335]